MIIKATQGSGVGYGSDSYRYGHMAVLYIPIAPFALGLVSLILFLVLAFQRRQQRQKLSVDDHNVSIKAVSEDVSEDVFEDVSEDVSPENKQGWLSLLGYLVLLAITLSLGSNPLYMIVLLIILIGLFIFWVYLKREKASGRRGDRD